MLGKVLKYEFRATAPLYLLLFAALLLLSVVNAVLLPINDHSSSMEATFGGGRAATTGVVEIILGTLTNISMFFYIITAMGVVLMVLVLSVVRFYRFLGAEGYLWLTLPVSAGSHILGKLISSLIWFLASLAVLLLSVGILLIKTGWLARLADFGAALQTVIQAVGFSSIFWIILIPALIILQWVANMLMFYAATAIGPNMIKSRLGGSVLAYVIISFVWQMISTAAFTAAAVFLNYYTASPAVSRSTTLAVFGMSVETGVLLIIAGECLLLLAVSVGLFLLARYFAAKKLNLP